VTARTNTTASSSDKPSTGAPSCSRCRLLTRSQGLAQGAGALLERERLGSFLRTDHLAEQAAQQFDVVVPLITQQLESAFVNLKPDHAAEIKDVFRVIPEKFSQKKQELLDQIAALYAEKLTADEINEIIKFYKTPVGTRFVQLQPELVQQSMVLGQAWGRKIGQEIDQEVRKQLKDRGVPI